MFSSMWGNNDADLSIVSFVLYGQTPAKNLISLLLCLTMFSWVYLIVCEWKHLTPPPLPPPRATAVLGCQGGETLQDCLRRSHSVRLPLQSVPRRLLYQLCFSCFYFMSPCQKVGKNLSVYFPAHFQDWYDIPSQKILPCLLTGYWLTLASEWERLLSQGLLKKSLPTINVNEPALWTPEALSPPGLELRATPILDYATTLLPRQIKGRVTLALVK